MDLNHRPLGYEPFKLSLIWRNLNPFLGQKWPSSWTQLWTQVSMNDIFAVSSRDPWEAYRRAYEIC